MPGLTSNQSRGSLRHGSPCALLCLQDGSMLSIITQGNGLAEGWRQAAYGSVVEPPATAAMPAPAAAVDQR